MYYESQKTLFVASSWNGSCIHTVDMIKVIIDGLVQDARNEEPLTDLIKATGSELAEVCYPLQSSPKREVPGR